MLTRCLGRRQHVVLRDESVGALLEGGQVAKQMIGFGFAIPAWRLMEFYEAPSIGRLPRDNTNFNPELWRPRVPNPNK